MIDGVTSRPFSAKTLPQMVKSGDKKVEEEVIRTSRELYCRPRGVIEREINEWSGMSLGDDNIPSFGGMEKFKIICSNCGLEKTVPFKPEPGRAVYCKECMAKIKAGEVKIEKKGQDQINYDESKFYKPLADLGIEFKQKNGDGKIETENRYPERIEKSTPPARPKIFSAIKKVFTREKPKENSALREVLNKTISLDALKDKNTEVKKPVATQNVGFVPSKDRAASAENMNKLKDLISAKVPTSTPPTPIQPTAPINKGQVKEVPEDVLRKILE